MTDKSDAIQRLNQQLQYNPSTSNQSSSKQSTVRDAALDQFNLGQGFDIQQGFATLAVDNGSSRRFVDMARGNELNNKWINEFDGSSSSEGHLREQLPVERQSMITTMRHFNRTLGMNRTMDPRMSQGRAPLSHNNITQAKQWDEEFEKVLKLESLAAKDENWQGRFEEAWENASNNIGPDYRPADLEELDTFDYETDPVISHCQPYVFELTNEYLSHVNPYQEGLEMIEQDGSLSEIALALEAAVQRDPHNDKAWEALGMIQAENEKENPAIAALQRAVQENPMNLNSLMSLAVSYTNEGQSEEAYSTLARWLRSSFPDLEIELTDDKQVALTSYFLRQIQNGEVVDANLQIGLGLLFYNIQDFGKTVDCFSAALALKPDDYLLWNRLGATLSNSGNSTTYLIVDEAAIDAFFKSLQLKPSFVRGRYNLGVSCMNIGCYKEAAEHFLGALKLHVIGSGEQEHQHVSRTLWDTLHRNFVLMDRSDLADLSLKSQDVSVFRSEFEF